MIEEQEVDCVLVSSHWWEWVWGEDCRVLLEGRVTVTSALLNSRSFEIMAGES